MPITFLTSEDEKKFVKTINGTAPDENGNVEITIPDSGQNVTLTTEQINALDGMFKVCAFTKADVSAEYTAFKTAFGIADATLTGISAVYSGGNVTAGTSVDALTGIVVTASYSDGSQRTVTGYTLSGTIAEGENTITVTYEGMTTTFTVTGVAEEVTLTSISATYSGGDVAVGTAVTDLTGIVVTAHYSDGSSSTVTGYSLSGIIAEGENTVTVVYGGMSTTITVVGVAEETDVLFHVENTQVNAVTDTGVDISAEDMDYTVCFDAVNKGDVTTGNSAWVTSVNSNGAVANGTHSPMIYKLDVYNNNGVARFSIGSSYNDATSKRSAIATEQYLKVVLTHERGSGLYAFNISHNLGGSAVTVTKTIEKEFAVGTATATQAYGTTSYPILFNDFTIYNRVLSDEEIAAYLA